MCVLNPLRSMFNNEIACLLAQSDNEIALLLVRFNSEAARSCSWRGEFDCLTRHAFAASTVDI